MANKQSVAVPLIPDPRGVNIPIQAIQNALIALPWLQYAYGKSFRNTKEVDGSRYVEPQVYVKNREFLSLEPDDVSSAFSFCEVVGKKRITEGSRKWDQDLSVVFYVNLEIINQVEGEIRDWIFTEELIEEATNILRAKNLSFIVEDTYDIDRGIEDSFDNYSYWTFDERYIKRNYDAFRINFIVQGNDECI